MTTCFAFLAPRRGAGRHAGWREEEEEAGDADVRMGHHGHGHGHGRAARDRGPAHRRRRGSSLHGAAKRLGAAGANAAAAATGSSGAAAQGGGRSDDDLGRLRGPANARTSRTRTRTRTAGTTSALSAQTSAIAALGAPGLPGSRSSANRASPVSSDPAESDAFALVAAGTLRPSGSSSGGSSSSSSSRRNGGRLSVRGLVMGKQKTPAQNATREVEAYLESLLVGGGRPSEIAEAFAELGDAQLRLGAHAQALESFAFCLSYSSPKMQATAYLGLAKTRFAIAKKQPKSKRAKTRDEALAALESALKLTKRFHADSPLEADVARLHEAVQALPFKVSV